MTVRCEFLERPKDAADVAQLLGREIIPIFQEYWEKVGQKLFNSPFGFDEQGSIAFMRTWMTGALLLIMAYDDSTGQDVPAGFILAAKLLPLMHKGTVLQVDSYYGRTPEVTRELFNFFKSVVPIISPSEIVIPRLPGYADSDHNISPKVSEQVYFRFER